MNDLAALLTQDICNLLDSDERVGWQETKDRIAALLRPHLRERPEPKTLWGWHIEEVKSAMRQFQSKYPGKLPLEIERRLPTESES